jgi:hypothetical protein
MIRVVLILALALSMCTSCAPNYEVVQRLDVNMYHLYNTRTQEIKIIISQDSLNEGGFIKLRNVKIIAEIE